MPHASDLNINELNKQTKPSFLSASGPSIINPCEVFAFGDISVCLVFQTKHRSQKINPLAISSKKSHKLTAFAGYNIRTSTPANQPHWTCAGRGSENIPLLHFVITRISVIIVASNSQQCWPILTARLKLRIKYSERINLKIYRNIPWIIDILIKFSHGW